MWSLFGRGKQNKKLVIKKYNKKFVEIVGIDFFGSFSESSNCRYIVAWSDFDPSSGQGGFREDGFGTYILAENGNVIVIGKAERPNDGKVADNGTFILNDWLFGEGLRGSFLAFDRRGQSILRHNFSANLFNNDISHTGSYAVCQLCNSNTDESGMLAFFDLRNGTLTTIIHDPLHKSGNRYCDDCKRVDCWSFTGKLLCSRLPRDKKGRHY